MNREQMNTWRTAHGLAPIVATPEQELQARKRKAQANANAAARAQQNREIRDVRNRNKK